MDKGDATHRTVELIEAAVGAVGWAGFGSEAVVGAKLGKTAFACTTWRTPSP